MHLQVEAACGGTQPRPQIGIDEQHGNGGYILSRSFGCRRQRILVVIEMADCAPIAGLSPARTVLAADLSTSPASMQFRMAYATAKDFG